MEAGFASSIEDAMRQPLGVGLRMLEEKAIEEARNAIEASEKNNTPPPDTPAVRLVRSFRVDSWTEKMQELADYKV